MRNIIHPGRWQRLIRQGALLNYLVRWGFWSLESDNDYYASLEDGTPIYSLTEKE